MVVAAKRDLEIYRHEPFVHVIGIPLLDLSGSAMSFEVRDNVADVAAVLVGVIVKAVSVVGGLPYTTVTITIAKATIEALGEPVPRGADRAAFYGFKIAGVEWMRGASPIKGQANHA